MAQADAIIIVLTVESLAAFAARPGGYVGFALARGQVLIAIF